MVRESDVHTRQLQQLRLSAPVPSRFLVGGDLRAIVQDLRRCRDQRDQLPKPPSELCDVLADLEEDVMLDLLGETHTVGSYVNQGMKVDV